MAKKIARTKKSSPKPASARKGKGKSKGNQYALLLVLILAVVIVGAFALHYIGGGAKKSVPDISQEDDNFDEEQNALMKEYYAEMEEPDGESPTDESEEDFRMDGAVEQPTRNEHIEKSTEVDEYYYTASFDFGWPAYEPKDQIVEHEAIAISYNEATEQANWVVYKLTANQLKGGVPRSNNFRLDPLVKTKSASPDDYKNSGFDPGHLAPAADFTWSAQAMDQSFYMSNISPQVPAFNRGIWKKLENKVRDWVLTYGQLYIVSGPIFGQNYDKIGKNKVGVPEAYFKVILDITEPELKAIAFIMPNAGSSDDIMYYAATIDDVELLTGFDFFPLLPDALETKLENSINKSLWK